MIYKTCVHGYICIYVYVDLKIGRQTRQTDRQTDREREREREIEMDR